jgi:hypothetical protein
MTEKAPLPAKTIGVTWRYFAFATHDPSMHNTQHLSKAVHIIPLSRHNFDLEN